VFSRVKLWFNSRHHPLSDFVLHRKYVGKLAVVAFSPDVIAGRGVYELGSDANPVSAFPHASFKDIPYT